MIKINISSEVTEYRAQILKDENGKLFVAKFPAGVSRPVQYGASVKAYSVYMSQQQLIPYDRIRDYFTDQCGIPSLVLRLKTLAVCGFAFLLGE